RAETINGDDTRPTMTSKSGKLRRRAMCTASGALLGPSWAAHVRSLGSQAASAVSGLQERGTAPRRRRQEFRNFPSAPMLRIDPALPMLRIDPALPMLRIDPALPTLRIDPALPTLPMLKKDSALN